LTFVHENIE